MRKYVPNLVALGSVGLAAIIGVAVAVGSAFPIFGRAMPWAMARLERDWPQRPPEQTIS